MWQEQDVIKAQKTQTMNTEKPMRVELSLDP